MIVFATAFYFGALVAATLAVCYLGYDVWLDGTARRRKAARQRSDEHVKALSRLRTGARTFASIRGIQAARARNGAAPARPLLLTYRPGTVCPPWRDVSWVQQVLPFRGAGPVVEDVREVPSWAH